MKKGTTIDELLDELKMNDPERYERINKAVEIRAKKVQEYKKMHNIPEFKSMEEYAGWLNTVEGKKYAKALEEIAEEAHRIASGRGGKREGAGRPKVHENRKTITKQLPEQTVIKIKDYSKNRHISENEALNELINAGYEQLKNRA